MKKILYAVLAVVIVIATSACDNDRPDNTNEKDYKIAVITQPLSEDPYTFEAAQNLKDKYGDTVVTVTYPHHHDTQPEQTVAMITDLAKDPDMRVIIFAETVNGTTAGIKKLRETRSDILVIASMNTENASEIAPLSDLCFIENKAVTGTSIVEQAAKMGAKTFVYITCQKDLANSVISAHEEQLKETCSASGISFIEATAPNPTGAEGLIGIQSWMNENIPRYVEQYGKNTAFYATDESMSTPLVRQIATCGAILPQLCNPSPYHGFPEAFDIDLKDRKADTDYLLHQVKTAIHSYENSGRMAAWSVPQSMIVIRAGVEYSRKWCEGTITERCDRETMNAAISDASGGDAIVSYYTDDKIGWISKSFAIQDNYYIF